MPPSGRDLRRKVGPTGFIHRRRITRGVAKRVEQVVQYKKGSALKTRKEMMEGLKRLSVAKLRSGETIHDQHVHMAFYIDEMISRIADHIVKPASIASRDKKVDQATLEDLASAYGLEIGPNLENELWEKQYQANIQILKAKKDIPRLPEALVQLEKIRRYEELPELVYRLRKEHGKRVEIIAKELTARGANPEQNLIEEVQRVLSRPYRQEASARETPNRLRAFDIVLASSIFADLSERTRTLPDVPSHLIWQHWYSYGMRLVFPLIRKHPEIFDKIVEFE